MSDLKRTIPAEVLTLSAAIADSLTLDKERGLLIEEKKGVYDQNLPEGITTETVKTLSEYDQLFVTAGRHAVGTAALEAFKAHKDLNELSCTLSYRGPKDSVVIDAARSREFKYQLNGTPQSVTKWCPTTVRVDINYGKNSPAMKAVNESILEAAKEAFGGK